MLNFGKWVVKHRKVILIIALLLLIPSVYGMVNTRVNYDIMTYLPEDMETMQGQEILMDEFGRGAFSLVLFEDMPDKDVSALCEDFRNTENVESVLWYDSVADISIPKEVLPQKVFDAFNNDNTTMAAVFFDSTTSSDETMEAVQVLREKAGDKCFITGMSAMVTDLKILCEKEEPVYVGIAVLLAVLAMMIFLDSWILPFIFLFSIGIAIIYNLGTNMFLGDISYITKAIAAVLQLGVTMDYSIFLWNNYKEQKVRYSGDKQRAMAHAISNTFTSVMGSAITTIAGFVSLCFMTFTLGFDLGIVMAKGVFIGLFGSIIILPGLILLFDKLIEKTSHSLLLHKPHKLSAGIVKRRSIIWICVIVIAIPAFYGYANVGKYYDMAAVMSDDLSFMKATKKLNENFDMATTHMIIADSKLPAKDAKAMMGEIKKTDGVKSVIGLDELTGSAIPEEVIPTKVKQALKSGDYQLILVNSLYHVSSDDANDQVGIINDIIKKYDSSAMLIGEAPATKDLIEVTDRDFTVVSIISIAAVFLIIAIVLKSWSLPFILILVIELAIAINLGIPYYTNMDLPFVAPICLATIQLGATVDYAILMTTRYRKERFNKHSKQDSVTTALFTSIPSIVVSAVGFFAATYGVGIYSNIDIVSSMCMIAARGALISMVTVILVLPPMFMLFDKIIIKTSKNFINKDETKLSAE